MAERKIVTKAEWDAEGERRFGKDLMLWKFVCPSCGHVAKVEDWKTVGANEGEVAFSCIGRHVNGSRDAFGNTGKGPCDYAGGGLFKINPVIIKGFEERFFDFAEAAEGSPDAK